MATLSRRLGWIAAAAALAAALVPPCAAATVVVAPLHDASPQQDADTVQGVTDLLAGVLAERVVVVARDKLAAILAEQRLTATGLADPKTAARVGKLLQADFVLTGSVFRGQDQVKFAVQLVSVSTGEVVKGITLDAQPDKLLETAAELAARCEAALSLKVETPGPRAAATHLAGERFFLEALGFYYAGNYDRAAMNCLKVIELDPNHQAARLRLAESFLAAGDAEQARITLHRALQLFPELGLEPRVSALLDKTDPLALQATERQRLTVALPDDWPKDAKVAYELTWQGQPARRDKARAAAGAVTLEMPGARLPLDLRLVLAVAGNQVVRRIRLWPAAPPITPPKRRLVLVDPTGEIAPLVGQLEHRVFQSCKVMPDAACHVVISRAAAARLDSIAAKSISAFVEAGGEVVVLGPATPGIELAGIKVVQVSWPMAKSWLPKEHAVAFSCIPASDLVAALLRSPRASLLSGGQTWLATDGGQASLVSAANKGRLVWIAWPLAWDASDPRCLRLAALALGDAVFETPLK